MFCLKPTETIRMLGKNIYAHKVNNILKLIQSTLQKYELVSHSNPPQQQV